MSISLSVLSSPISPAVFFCAGDSLEEAIENSKEAIATWIEITLDEGGEIPASGELSDHLKNPEFKGWTWISLNGKSEKNNIPCFCLIYQPTNKARFGNISSQVLDQSRLSCLMIRRETNALGSQIINVLKFILTANFGFKIMRKLGRKDRPFGLRAPTKEEMEWVESWAKLYVSRVPKGVFKYKNHEEANADWDKWMAQGRFKPMTKIYDGLNSNVILSELPEDEQGRFFQHLIDYGHTIPSPGQAFRWDYDNWKQSLQTARDAESAMLDRCLAVAKEESQSAQDQREANVFKLAAMVIQPRRGHTTESKRLMQASEQYFSVHPTEELEPGEVVRKGWIDNLPRLRDMLKARLKKESPQE